MSATRKTVKDEIVDAHSFRLTGSKASDSAPSSEPGSWSKMCRAVRILVTEIGKNAPTGEYYAIEDQEAFLSKTDVESTEYESHAPRIPADPYGLISR